MIKSSSLLIEDDIIYPESDGKQMADNTKQYHWITLIKEGLEVVFADNPQVFIAADLLWYPVKGNPHISQAPDILVVFDRPKGDRSSYLQWKEENIAPQVVFEILSPSNTFSEMLRKFRFYEQYGVAEYYMYDPDTNSLEGWLNNLNLLVSIQEINDWASPRLGIRFELSASSLDIYAPNGNKFESYLEIVKRLEQAEENAKAEKEKREKAEQLAEKYAAKLRALGISTDD